MSKDIGEYKHGSSVGDIEGISRGTEDSLSSINFDDDFIIDDIDDKSYEFQVEEPKIPQPKGIQEEWTPDEQFRLLYVYFKDMAVESLLNARQEVEVSAKIKPLLTPFPSKEMDMHQVSKIVNSPKNDVPECVVPINN